MPEVKTAASNNYLKDIIKDEVLAVGPVTAKQIHKYLHSQGIECDMYEVAEQLTALIKEDIVRIGDEGNTFDPGPGANKVR